MHKVSGGCHCGNIRYAVDIPVPIDSLPARHCSCSYCMRHGGIYGAHPDAKLTITVQSDGETTRYRFATMTTDFLICTVCGVPTIVLDDIDGATYALLKLNTLDESPDFSNAPYTSMEGEEAAARRDRRRAHWISSVSIVKDG